MTDISRPGTVHVPQDLSYEQIARKLYPEVLDAKTPVQYMGAAALMRREHRLVGLSLDAEKTRVASGQVTLETSRVQALTRQREFLDHYRRAMHQAATQSYFSAKGWPTFLLNEETRPQEWTWHFFYRNDRRAMPSISSYRPRKNYHRSYIEVPNGQVFAVRHRPGEETLYLRSDSGYEAYEGPTEGLHEWAVDNLVLLMTLDAKSVVAYLDGNPTPVFQKREQGPVWMPWPVIEKTAQGKHWVSSPDMCGYPFMAHDRLAPSL
jgi:hypothetical protein